MLNHQTETGQMALCMSLWYHETNSRWCHISCGCTSKELPRPIKKHSNSYSVKIFDHFTAEYIMCAHMKQVMSTSMYSEVNESIKILLENWKIKFPSYLTVQCLCLRNITTSTMLCCEVRRVKYSAKHLNKQINIWLIGPFQ